METELAGEEIFYKSKDVASSLKWKYLSILVCYFPVIQIPSDLLDKEFLPILQEEPLPPLALVPFTEEEQVCILFLFFKKKATFDNCVKAK